MAAPQHETRITEHLGQFRKEKVVHDNPSDAASEYVSVSEAREILGVSPTRMAEMLKQGELEAETNPVDRRGKLIKRAAVEALARKAGRLGKNHSPRRPSKRRRGA